MTCSQIIRGTLDVTSPTERELCSQKEGFLVSFHLPERATTALQGSLWRAIFPLPGPVADNITERTFTSQLSSYKFISQVFPPDIFGQK